MQEIIEDTRTAGKAGGSWTIKRRIIVGFSLVFLLVCLLEVVVLRKQAQMASEVEMVGNQSVPANEYLAVAAQAASNNRALIFKHIHSPDEEEMKGYEAIIARNGRQFDEAFTRYEALPLTPETRALAEKVRATLKSMRVVRTEILQLSHKATTPESAVALHRRALEEFEPSAEVFSNTLAELQALEQTRVRQVCGVLTDGTTLTSRILLWVGGGILLLSICVSAVMIRGINRLLVGITELLRQSSQQLDTASSQVAESSQELANGASSQAASLEETSASLEEIGGMTRRNAESAQNAKQVAMQARQASELGAEQVHGMVDAMNAIKASSANIAAIIKTIDEIAFQTNILALNAAVEAARAGEAGAGFAVVAEEVRNLAQRAAAAARETAEKIDDSIAKSARGADMSNQVSQSLIQIAEKSRQVDTLVAEIATASTEQSQGLTQIGQAVSQMDQITQRNASGSEEIASASQELRKQASVLTDVVDRLRHLVVNK